TPNASGTHTITATYPGDTTHDGSSGTTGVTATKHSTATGLVCDPSVPVGIGRASSGAGADSVATAPFPTGLVNFFADGAATPFTRCSLSGSGVTQSCSVSYTPTTAGPHSIVAKYAGDGAHADSTSPPAAVTATKHPTATGLVCDPSVPVGSAASCTATVTDSVATAPFPTGLVNFFADGAATPFTNSGRAHR